MIETSNPANRHGGAVVVQRHALLMACVVLNQVVENPCTPDDLREAARDVYGEMNFWATFGEYAAEYAKPDPLPFTLRWPGEATGRVDRIAAANPFAVQHLPAYFAMARTMARHIDDEGNGLPFRMDCLESLEMVLTGIKEHIADAQSEGW
ncbi:hypothetical protein [Mycolicibacterium sp. CBMA 226]|uniref:hypothetical protein n=1 Tax=Mycolicibacterium sp. CBMA 226 TaxID=2606611 RepID=UPI0012DEB085|nr:hypothetical protein [Mycolicibacterium sp. CBMA 226]MUL75709.1 hypothetical protein [Mycolicibacterium sp. CBMA 226]